MIWTESTEFVDDLQKKIIFYHISHPEQTWDFLIYL